MVGKNEESWKGEAHLLTCRGVDDADVGEVGEAGGCEAPVEEVDVVFEGVGEVGGGIRVVEGCVGAGFEVLKFVTRSS